MASQIICTALRKLQASRLWQALLKCCGKMGVTAEGSRCQQTSTLLNAPRHSAGGILAFTEVPCRYLGEEREGGWGHGQVWQLGQHSVTALGRNQDEGLHPDLPWNCTSALHSCKCHPVTCYGNQARGCISASIAIHQCDLCSPSAICVGKLNASVYWGLVTVLTCDSPPPDDKSLKHNSLCLH